MAEWWEEYTAQPAAQPASQDGNWWDAYAADFGNVESGAESRPSFADVKGGALMSAAEDYRRRTEAGIRSGEIPLPLDPSAVPLPQQTRPERTGWDALLELADSPVSRAIQDNPLIRGFAGRVNEAAAGVNLLTLMPIASAVDAMRGDNMATDVVGSMVQQPRERAAALMPSADASFGEKLISATGGLAFDLPSAMVSKPLQAANALPRFLAATDTAVVKQLLGDAFKEAAMTARVPATTAGLSTALSVIDSGGTPEEAIKAGLADAGGTGVNFVLPLNIAGGIASRGLQGAAVNVVGEAAQNTVTNQFLPDELQRPLYDPEQLGISAVLGAPMAIALGERAPRSAPQARARELTNELTVDANRIRTPESDAVDAGRETARAIFAEADAAARPDPATNVPETVLDNSPEFSNQNRARLAELEAKPEPTLFEREEMALLQEGKPFDRQALLADLESAPEPELIRNGTRVFYPGDVKTMRAKLAEAGLSEGMRKTNEDGSDAGLYFPAKMQAEVDAVLRPSKPSAPTGTEAAELDATIEAPVAAAKDAMAALQALNPQLANELRVEALSDEEMDSRPANTVSGKGAGAGRNGSVINLKKIGATFSEVKEEIRHMVDTLLGGGQVAKWIDEDAGMQRRVRDFLNGRHKLGDLAPNTRYDDGAEIAQSLLDQYFRNPDAVREALPDMATFLEQMGADKYRPVMDALAEAEKTNASREPVRARETAAPVETTPAAPYQGPAIPPPKKQRNQVRSTADFDPNYHDIRDFIALNGGLDFGAFKSEFKSEIPDDNVRFFGKPLFRKNGGMKPDQLRELMQESGFLNEDSPDAPPQYTPQDAYDLVDRALDGNPVYHPAGVDVQNQLRANNEYDAEQERRQAYIDEHGVTPELDSEFADRAAALDRGDLERLYSKRAASGDMFAPATANERNNAAVAEKDAQRNGLGRDLVPPSQGPGDLFAGARPKQETLKSRPDTQGIEVDEATPSPAIKRSQQAPAESFRGMTRDEFLGDPKITKTSSAAELKPRQITSLAEIEPVPFDSGSGALTARYSPDGAAVYDGDKVIASYNFGDTLVVDKNYRKQGIGEELVYQWRTRNPNAKPAKTRTKASQKLQEKVWDRISRENGRPEGGIKRSQRPDTQGIEVDEATDLTPEELAALNRQVDTGRGQRETPSNDRRTSPSNADSRRDGARRTVEDQGGRSGQPVPVQDGTFAPDASLDASSKPPKFPRWFRQSKLKNPKGIPLEFNHTTNADFDTFDSSRRGSNTGYAPSGLGNWFSQSVEGYGSKKLTGNIRMENPKVMPLHKLPDLDTQEDFAAYADKLRDQGFDGIYFPDVKQAVTFDSVQFKENDNTEYSESPNIYRSAREEPAPKTKRLSDAEVAKAKADAESRVASHWGRSAVNKLKTRGRVEFITKQEVVDRGLQTMAELDGVDGFFDPESGKAYVIADSGAQSADLPGVLSHEVFHANAEQFLGTDGFKRLKEAFRKLKSRDKDIAAAYKRVPSDTSAAHVDEEGLAYLAQEAPKHRLSERLTDEAKLFLNRLGIPLDWLNAHAAAVRKIAALNLKDAGNRGRVARFTKDGVKYQKVFHGTPHRGIEQTGFKLQKVGTGEGAQAYGYGMYFAGNKDIAEHYRKTLSAQNDQKSNYRGLPTAYRVDGKDIARGNPDYAAADIVHIMQNYGPVEAGWLTREIGARGLDLADTRKRVKRLSSKTIGTVSGGQLYHAEIPEDSDLLDWDKPLSEQPEKVKAALAKLSDQYGFEYADSYTGREMYRALASDANAEGLGTATGRDPEQAASELLLAAGVPGLRYRDGGSRGQGQMSYQDGLPAGFKYEKDQSGVGIKNEKGLWLTTGHRSEADAHRNLFGPRPSHNYVIWDETLLTPEKAQITPYYSKRDKPKPKVTGARPEELIEVRKQISSFRTLIKCLGG